MSLFALGYKWLCKNIRPAGTRFLPCQSKAGRCSGLLREGTDPRQGHGGRGAGNQHPNKRKVTLDNTPGKAEATSSLRQAEHFSRCAQ
ncbi:hypothetical protein NDU88_004525 [Pleurodeles waltl]|uniref:Uncharacterized protein n=1 Tax=Pleurodeles waltl TaxID=8319 RepID=A0AAV7WVC2_PLEWA|nr:hypothetical protein NDU88_004525 [Pleurodeles waltl]